MEHSKFTTFGIVQTVVSVIFGLNHKPSGAANPRKEDINMSSIDLVGKTLKSKINGNMFYVAELFTEHNFQYYKICDVASGGYFAVGKEWFEIGYMQNLEIIQ